MTVQQAYTRIALYLLAFWSAVIGGIAWLL